jgi:hypothetical protein
MSNSAGAARTIAKYCHTIDDGRLEEWAELFEPDGAFIAPGLGTIRGRDNLRHYGEGLLGVLDGFGVGAKHLTFNSAIDIDGDRATAVSDFAVIANAAGAWSIMGSGRYTDELVHTDQWRFVTRTLTWYRDEAPAGLAPAVAPLFEKFGEVQ